MDDVELTKAYFDVSAFHNRLHKEVLAQATEQAALTPKQLYEAALPELIGLIEQSEIYPFLRDRDTDVLDAQEELSAKLDELLSGLKDSRPALYEAYTTLPDFREYLIDDILERTYQDMVTDRRTSVEQHENDPDAPAWVPLTAWTMILVRSACGMIPLRPEPDSRFSEMSRCLTSGNWSKTLGTRNWKNWLHPALRCRSRPNRQHLCSPNRLKQKITALLLPIWEWAARKQSIRRMWLLSGC